MGLFALSRAEDIEFTGSASAAIARVHNTPLRCKVPVGNEGRVQASPASGNTLSIQRLVSVALGANKVATSRVRVVVDLQVRAVAS